MGNSAPTNDDRVQRCAEILQMTKSDISVFHDVFRSQDIENKGFISVAAFFQVIGEPRSILGQALFELIGTCLRVAKGRGLRGSTVASED